MESRRRFASWTVAAAATATTLMMWNVSPAAAQGGPGGTASADLELFEPQHSPGINLLNLTRSDVLQHLFPSVGLVFDYASVPYVLRDAVGEPEIVEDRMKLSLVAGLGFFDLFDLGIALPLTVAQSGAELTPYGQPGVRVEGISLGDLRVVPKVRLLNAESAAGWGLALTVPIGIPIGDETRFHSFGGATVTPTLAADWRDVDTDDGFTIVANLGFRVQPKRVVGDTPLNDALRWGVGFAVPVGVPGLNLLVSAHGLVPVDGDVGPGGWATVSPAEVDGAVQLRMGEFVVNAGAGTGLSRGVGAPDVRAFFTVAWVSRTKDRDEDGVLDRFDGCIDEAEDADGFEDGDGCPDIDNDGDGFWDVDDGDLDRTLFGHCRDEPEDKDGFEDGDGCPDPDNDGDGVPDLVDGELDASGFGRCRDFPEDVDGFKDDDGCPEGDNDGDGVPDKDDGPPDDSGLGSCRDVAEDVDGFEDGDGCLDADNDGDGIPDVRDGEVDADGFGVCRDEPETVNGHADDDGCPDKAPTRVEVTRFTIEIPDAIHFAYNAATIKRKSYKLLKELADIINGHPQLTKIRIEGHTDFHGNDFYNKELSQRRADEVRKHLIRRGKVAEGRLLAEGFGESRPIMSGSAGWTKEGVRMNRRVEFHIVEVGGKPHSPETPVVIETREVVPND